MILSSSPAFGRLTKIRASPRIPYCERWLSVLFFEAFNNKFQAGRHDRQHLPADIRNALANAPYLNGGLFRENDLDQRYPVAIPDAQFRDIFEFLNAYNFTIAESPPFDIEVAVDPEMIGKVYESLVNITFEGTTEEDRRGMAGIFYTPRVEIDLMCRLSLVDCLANHLGTEHKTLLYQALFAYDPDEKREADEALTNLVGLSANRPAGGDSAKSAAHSVRPKDGWRNAHETGHSWPGSNTGGFNACYPRAGKL